jgi:hydroxyacyl-ACP dehydratase HTD2-like protein with hotdog domain
VTEESLITDEMRAVVGKEAEPLIVEVDKTAIRWFARAVGHTDLVFYDEAYAKSKGHRSIICPPGFLGHAIHTPQNPTNIIGNSVKRTPMPPGIKVTRLLNGGTEFEYYGEDICAGDVLKSVGKITDLRERTGSLGKMLIMQSESNFFNQKGKLVATERGTGIIY